MDKYLNNMAISKKSYTELDVFLFGVLVGFLMGAGIVFTILK